MQSRMISPDKLLGVVVEHEGEFAAGLLIDRRLPGAGPDLEPANAKPGIGRQGQKAVRDHGRNDRLVRNKRPGRNLRMVEVEDDSRSSGETWNVIGAAVQSDGIPMCTSRPARQSSAGDIDSS